MIRNFHRTQYFLKNQSQKHIHILFFPIFAAFPLRKSIIKIKKI